MVNITINGKALAVKHGTTIMEAATQMGIPIPHLCYLKDINEIGACRICVVEVEGTERLVPACNTRVVEGMSIHTNTPRVREARKTNLRLILSQHNSTCTTCIRSGNCELQQLCKELGVTDEGYYDGERTPSMIDDSAVHMIRDNSKCILFIRGERPVVDFKYNLLKHPNIRYTEDGGAAPYDYTAADNARDDLPGAPENYELLDMDDFLPAEAAEMKPTIQRIRRPK